MRLKLLFMLDGTWFDSQHIQPQLAIDFVAISGTFSLFLDCCIIHFMGNKNNTLVIFADKRRGGGGLQLVFQVSVCMIYMSLIRNKEQVTGN